MSNHRIQHREASQPGPDLSSLETDAGIVLEMILIAQADAWSITDAAPVPRHVINRLVAVLTVAQDQIASLQAQLAFAADQLALRAPIAGKEAA